MGETRRSFVRKAGASAFLPLGARGGSGHDPTAEMHRSFVHAALKEHVPGYGTTVDREVWDNQYKVPTREYMREAAAADETDEMEWRKNHQDCENFAVRFMQHMWEKFDISSVGCVYDDTAMHVYNIVVYRDGTVEFFEPQTDEFFPPSELPRGNGLHELESGTLLL